MAGGYEKILASLCRRHSLPVRFRATSNFPTPKWIMSMCCRHNKFNFYFFSFFLFFFSSFCCIVNLNGSTTVCIQYGLLVSVNDYTHRLVDGSCNIIFEPSHHVLVSPQKIYTHSKNTLCTCAHFC